MMAYKKGAQQDIEQRQALPPRNSAPDLNTGQPWSEMDIEDLRAAWKTGDDLEQLSTYLCRDWEEVAAKCKELNLDLEYQSRRRAGREAHLKQKRLGS